MSPTSTFNNATQTTQTSAQARPRDITLIHLVAVWATGVLAGVIVTGAFVRLTAPLPVAIVAQMDRGTVLTAPTGCLPGDQVYQAMVNGGSAAKLENGKLVKGNLDVTVTAKFTEDGIASTAIIQAKTVAGGNPPILDAAYAWMAPTSALPGTALEYSVVRYVFPPGTGRAELPRTKLPFRKGGVVFVCVTNEPR